jgi:acyl-CoA synthetase (AMP-forming)/AMP-acid ligase II
MDNRILYNRWKNTLDAHKYITAVIDLQTGDRLTFTDLDALVQKKPSVNNPVIGDLSGVDFIVQTLWAWRENVPFVPIEKEGGLNLTLLDKIPDNVAHIKHTSGTTGAPRMVLFTEEQLAADVDQIVETMELNNYDWNIGMISLVHSYGFSNLILPLLLYGIPLALCSSPLPETLKHAFSELTGRGILPAVPAMWSAWNKAGVLIDSPVGLAISAGAPLSATLEEDVFVSSGIKVHNFYGSSECGAIAYDGGNSPRIASNIIGRPIAGVDLSLGENGRLIVRSRATASGYWPNQDREELGNGRFLTSDLAEIDRNKEQVNLIGRVSEIINVAGRKLSPLAVEQVILEIEGIETCVVFGVPSSNVDRAEDIVACFRALGDINDKEIFSILRKQLPAWQVPKRLWNCNQLKINKLGKISRAYWKERYMQGAFH